MEKLFQVYVWRRGRWVWHSELTNKIRQEGKRSFKAAIRMVEDVGVRDILRFGWETLAFRIHDERSGDVLLLTMVYPKEIKVQESEASHLDSEFVGITRDNRVRRVKREPDPSYRRARKES